MKPIKYNDYPLLEVVAQVSDLVEENDKKGIETLCFQKWTCNNCGSRQIMDAPNMFHMSGKCEECGEVSIIEKCNYLATFSAKISQKEKH